MKRKEVAVKKQPGIYKCFVFDEEKQKWIDTGKYRAMKRVVRDGQSVKEQGKFDSFEDAKNFRIGLIEKTNLDGVRRTDIEPEQGLTFGALVEEWKAFHFLRIDYATRQTYEKRLPHLETLMSVPLTKFNPQLIDKLVKYWVLDYPKPKGRFTFDKELDLMKVILNFYRRRKDAHFAIPIYDEHYKAAHIKKDAVQPVRTLTQKDLGLFFQALREQKNPLYYPLALSQFCLGLRIGEACGLHWKDVNLETKVAKIESTVVWDHENWQPRIKSRPKNGKARFVAMPETLVTELTRLKESKSAKTDLVFHADGEPLIRKSVGQAYNRALALIGVDYVSGTHLLRKTAATQANRVTGDFYAVSRLMDHATPDVTMRYVEEMNESKRKVSDALESVMQSLVNKPD